jgi:hypothetical protein
VLTPTRVHCAAEVPLLATFEPPDLAAAYAPAPPELLAAASGGGDPALVRRRHQLGKAGVITMAAGAGAVAGGLVLALSVPTLTDGDVLAGGSLAITGVFVAGLGGVAIVTGEVLLFVGGIGASSALGEPTTTGWVGVGLAIGAVGISAITPQSRGMGVIGFAASVGGIVCGAVELSEAGRAGRAAGSLSLVPTGRGLALAGTY